MGPACVHRPHAHKAGPDVKRQPGPGAEPREGQNQEEGSSRGLLSTFPLSEGRAECTGEALESDGPGSRPVPRLAKAHPTLSLFPPTTVPVACLDPPSPWSTATFTVGSTERAQEREPGQASSWVTSTVRKASSWNGGLSTLWTARRCAENTARGILYLYLVWFSFSH